MFFTDYVGVQQQQTTTQGGEEQEIEEEIIELEVMHDNNIVTIDEMDQVTTEDYVIDGNNTQNNAMYSSVLASTPEHVVADTLNEMNEMLQDYFDRTSTRFAVTVSKGIRNAGTRPYFQTTILDKQTKIILNVSSSVKLLNPLKFISLSTRST